MNQHQLPRLPVNGYSRRAFLEHSGLGLGALALAYLQNGEAHAQPPVANTAGNEPVFNDLLARPGHFPGQAKAVIQLYQEGGPSQVDLFDPKPELTRRNGQPHPGAIEAMSPNNRNV